MTSRHRAGTPEPGVGAGAVLALVALVVFAGVVAGVGAAAALGWFLEWIVEAE